MLTYACWIIATIVNMSTSSLCSFYYLQKLLELLFIFCVTSLEVINKQLNFTFSIIVNNIQVGNNFFGKSRWKPKFWDLPTKNKFPILILQKMTLSWKLQTLQNRIYLLIWLHVTLFVSWIYFGGLRYFYVNYLWIV